MIELVVLLIALVLILLFVDEIIDYVKEVRRHE